MRIAVTGGTGFVGRTLIDRALAQGHEIVALARKPQEAREGVEWVPGDLDDRRALVRLVSDAEAVVHAAGVVNATEPGGFDQCNVIGTFNVIETVAGTGPQRLIFVSSLSAREPGLSAYGGSKARAERLVKASALDWTIVRPPAVYGPSDRELLELFRAAKWGFVPTPLEGRASIIHAQDLADLLLALLPGGDGVTGRVFEPDDGQPGGWSHYDLARAIGHAIGKRPRVLALSRRAMERAARLDGAMRGKGAKLTLDRAAYLSHPDWVVSENAAVPRERWRPRIETREGLKTTAQWYRREGWL